MAEKILSSILPISFFLAFSGTGFGLWVFSTNTESQTTYANYEVTSAASLDGLELNLTDSKITLDASGSDLIIGGNLSCTIDIEKGLVGTVNSDGDGYDVTEASGTPDLNVKYHIGISFSRGIEKYLSTDSVYPDFVGSTRDTEYDFSRDYSTSGTYSYYLSVTFKWKSFLSSIDDYTTMVSIIKSQESKVTVTASIPDTPTLTVK